MRVQIQDPNLEIHFKAIDVVFTIIFLLELLTNMACNWSEMLII
jgi:type III secretory pathway component EscS